MFSKALFKCSMLMHGRSGSSYWNRSTNSTRCISFITSLQKGPAEASPEFVEIEFPPDEEGVSALAEYCNKRGLPVCFGKNVSLESYNKWLEEKEDGLRVSYDAECQVVVLREGDLVSHGTTRAHLLVAMQAAFSPYGYSLGLGQLTTPPGLQNVSPDVWLASGPGAYPVVAEVGVSQSINQLNERADFLLSSLPGAQVVILIKVFDTTGAENGRMAAWCATQNNDGILVLTAMVEFGRVGPGGAPRVPWAAGTPSPSVVVPAHGAVPATSVFLNGILIALRIGAKWKHPPPP